MVVLTLVWGARRRGWWKKGADSKIAFVALLVAMYGAGLSTWSQLREAGDGKLLALTTSFQGTHLRFEGKGAQKCIQDYRLRVTAINAGTRPLMIATVGLKTNRYATYILAYTPRHRLSANSRYPTFSGPRLPRKLDDSEQVTFSIDVLAADQAIRADHESRAQRPLTITEVEVQDNLGHGATTSVPVPRRFPPGEHGPISSDEMQEIPICG